MGSKKKDSFMWFDLYVCLITKNYIFPERKFNEHFNNTVVLVKTCKLKNQNIYEAFVVISHRVIDEMSLNLV